jgi:biotin operon repressor
MIHLKQPRQLLDKSVMGCRTHCRCPRLTQKGTATVSEAGMEDDSKLFIKVPLWLLKREDISASAELIYGRLMLYAWGKKNCYPSQSTLGVEVGMTRRAVRKHVSELKRAGLVSSQKRGQHQSALYTLHVPPGISDRPERAHLNTPDRHERAQAIGTNVTIGIDQLNEIQANDSAFTKGRREAEALKTIREQRKG